MREVSKPLQNKLELRTAHLASEAKRGVRGCAAKGEGNIFFFRGSDVSEVGAFVSEHFFKIFWTSERALGLGGKKRVGSTPSTYQRSGHPFLRVSDVPSLLVSLHSLHPAKQVDGLCLRHPCGGDALSEPAPLPEPGGA